MYAGDFALTFENAGGKKSVRNFSFETDAKALDFVQSFNSVSQKSKITQVTKCLFPLITSKFSFGDDTNGLQTMKVMYETTNGVLANCSIPFCYNMSRTDLKSFLMYVKNFKEINNVLIDKIV